MTDQRQAEEQLAPPPREVSIFVSDASAEADRLSTALRARGYTVVDVPLSLLTARVGVQQPSLILLDIDAEGALQTAAKIRDIPGGASIDILFLGESGRTLADAADALRHEGSGFFVRPVDVDALLRKVEVLIGASGGAAGHSGSPSIPPATMGAKPSSARPGRPGGVALASRLSPPPPSGRLSSPPASPRAGPLAVAPADPWAEEAVLPPGPGTFDVDAAGASLASAAMPASKLSPEVEKLLLEAESRLGDDIGRTRARSSRPPSPEEEVEAVLPAELLAALDDPLDEEDDDPISESGSGGHTPARSTSASRPPTTGAGRTSTGTSTNADTRPPAPRPVYPPPVVLSDGVAPSVSAGAAPAAAVPPAAMPPAGVAPAAMPPAVDPVLVPAAPELASMARPTSRPHALSSARAAIPSPLPPSPPAPAPITPADRLRGEAEGDEPLTAIPRPAVPRPARLPADMLPAGPSADETYELLAQAGSPAALSARASAGSPAEAAHPSSSAASAPTAPPPAAPRSRSSDPSGLARGHPPAAPAPARGRSKSIPPIPTEIEGLGAVRALAICIRERATGALCIDCPDGVRRILLRDGDLVTAASGLDRESLVEFLASRGDLTRQVSARLRGKVPAFGRHAGAALVANGQLTQDQLWPVLRAHAEWVIGNAVGITQGVASFEREPPARLKAEPSVFGGAAGAEVFIEVLRRVIAAEVALSRIGGATSLLGRGPRADLIGECALSEAAQQAIGAADGSTVAELLAQVPEAGFSAAVYALVELGVLAIQSEADRPRPPAPAEAPSSFDPLDEEALREQVRARLSLVEEGDYFALLGVPRKATAYEIRRAYLELRRTFEPSRVPASAMAELADHLRLIVEVLDEAYDILRDDARRERYRRAIEASPAS